MERCSGWSPSREVNSDLRKCANFNFSFADLSLILGALVFNSLYSPLATATDLTGSAYLVAAACLVLPLLLLAAARAVQHIEHKQQPAPALDAVPAQYSNHGYQT